jgi:nicotinamidase-related amidase
MTDEAKMSASLDLSRVRAMYLKQGMAARVGLGERIAIVNIDFQYGFTDPEYSLGGDVSDAIGQAVRLAETARSLSIPVTYTTCVWSDVAEVWARKLPAQRDLVDGSRLVAIDDRIEPQDGELVVKKNFASGFCRTDLDDRLKEMGIDTVILCGVSTSGCVRASAVDGCSLGYRVIVASDAVADRAPEPHEMALFDIDAKYGDVMSSSEIIEQLTSRQ